MRMNRRCKSGLVDRFFGNARLAAVSLLPCSSDKILADAARRIRRRFLAHNTPSQNEQRIPSTRKDFVTDDQDFVEQVRPR